MASRRRSKQADQLLGGVAAQPRRLAIDRLELLLGDVAVIALQLLLGPKLLAVVRQLAAPALAMLAGAVFALVEGAFRTAPDILAKPPVDLVLGVNALRHASKLQSQIERFRGLAPRACSEETVAGEGGGPPGPSPAPFKPTGSRLRPPLCYTRMAESVNWRRKRPERPGTAPAEPPWPIAHRR